VDVAKKAVQALGGSIIVTTSVQAYTPSDHLLDYAATKAALNNLVVNLAGDLGAQGTRVNAVAPGPIWTPLIPATMSEKKVSGFGADTPLGRAGHPIWLYLPGGRESSVDVRNTARLRAGAS